MTMGGGRDLCSGLACWAEKRMERHSEGGDDGCEHLSLATEQRAPHGSPNWGVVRFFWPLSAAGEFFR